jgi:hypothetical protein
MDEVSHCRRLPQDWDKTFLQDKPDIIGDINLK